MLEDEIYKKLRADAEARLRSLSKLSEVPTAEEVKSLVHELRVYQIELEMQNQELREAQQRLEESRDQYTDLFEFAPLGYFILDRNGIILNCNLTGCGMLSVERSRLTRKPFTLFVESIDVGTFRKFLQKIFNNEGPQTCELQLQRKEHIIFTARLDTLKMKDEKGQLTQCRMALTDVSKEKNAENIQGLVEAVLQGQESERERIAAELHDSINPLLSIASLNIESLLEKENQKSTAFLNKQLDNTLVILENAIQGVKEISSNLSPAVLKKFGLVDALGQLCKRVIQTGLLKVDYQTHGMKERLELKTELDLYRIAQELLNNILQHAGATKAEIQLIHHKNSVILMVNDNGVGFDPLLLELTTVGFGFKNITSRIQTLNGILHVDSVKNKGTTITIELPI